MALGGDQLPFNIFFYNRWEELQPAYNQITSLSNTNFNTKKLKGLIIHCVSFGNGPWDSTNLFHEEWRENLNKYNSIDLKNIPMQPIIADGDIQKINRSVINAYLLGGTLSLKSILKRGLGAVTLIAHPGRALKKIQSLFGR